MNVDPIIGEAIIIGTGLLFTCAATKGKGRREDKLTQDCRRSIQHYVKTGEKTKAFRFADRSTIASAERARVRLLNEQRREIENYNIEFKAVQQCPKCKEFDVHWLRTREDGKINGRVCKHCGYGWHTVG